MTPAYHSKHLDLGDVPCRVPSCLTIVCSLLLFAVFTVACDSGPTYDLSCLEEATDAPGGFVDHDQDGLSDDEEQREFKTNPCAVDTDGDGASDLIEVRGSGTDPKSAEDTIGEGDFAIVLPFEGPAVEQDLSFETDIRAADIYFLVDCTKTMTDEIDNVRKSVTRIFDKAKQAIPGSELGVGCFQDFPFLAIRGGAQCNPTTGRCSAQASGFGLQPDRPFEALAPIGSPIEEIEAALVAAAKRTRRRSGDGDAAGGDIAESHIEAILQSVRGSGGSFPQGDWAGTTTVAPAQCPEVLDGEPRRFGAACFREGALPLVVLVSDAPWGDRSVIAGAASYDDAVQAMREVGARFVGVTVTGDKQQESFNDMSRMGRDTQTVDRNGDPVVSFASRGAIDGTIVRNIESVARDVRQDVGTRIDAVEGVEAGNGVSLIKTVVPFEAVANTSSRIEPYLKKTETTFEGLLPGSDARFRVTFQNDTIAPELRARLYQAKISVVGNRVTGLDERNAYFVVPPRGVEGVRLE